MCENGIYDTIRNAWAEEGRKGRGSAGFFLEVALESEVFLLTS